MASLKFWNRCLSNVGEMWFFERPSAASAANCVSFRLSSASRAGAVLLHVTSWIDRLLEVSEGLCVFKVGLTRDPAARWSHKVYGYDKDADKFAGMLVLAESSSGLGIGFLEAAVIAKYAGTAGFRNIASGGEGLAPDVVGPFFLYLVYKIIPKRPPQ